MAINKPDFLAGYSLFYESARYGADFLAAIEINRDLLTSLAHPPAGETAHNPPLSGICSLRSHIPQPEGRHTIPSLRDLLTPFAHPPAACGGAGQISQKAPSSKLVVLFDLFAVRGGFEPPVRLPVRQFSKLVV